MTTRPASGSPRLPRWPILRDPAGIILIVLALGVVTAVQVLPSPARFGAEFATNPGDPALFMWKMTLQAHAVVGHLTNLNEGNIYYPHHDVLAYNDNLIAFLPVFGPALWLSGGNSIVAYNVLALLGYLGGALAVYALAHHLLGARMPAFGAALLFTAAPYRTASVGHLQLIGYAFVPLAFLFLMRLLEKGLWRDAFLLGACAGLCWLGALYCAMMLAVALPAFFVVWLAQRRLRVGSWLWPRLIVSIVCAAALVAPSLPAYLRIQATGGNTRDVAELITARPGEFTNLPPSVPWRLLGHAAEAPIEQDALFPGFVMLGLAAVGAMTALLRWRRHRTRDRSTAPPLPHASDPLAARRREFALPLLAAGLVCLAVMVGPRHTFLVSLPDRVMRKALPGMSDLRDLVRFWLVPLTLLALTAGLGLAELLRRLGPRSGAAIAAVLLAIGGLEIVFRVPTATVALSGPKVAANEILRDLPPGVVVELPLASPLSYPYNLAVAPRQLRSLIDGDPRIEGYSGNMPADTRAIVEVARLLPDGTALQTLRRYGARYLILHGGPQPCWGDYGPDELTAMTTALAGEPGVERLITAGPDVVVVLTPADASLDGPVRAPATPAPDRPAPGCDQG